VWLVVALSFAAPATALAQTAAPAKAPLTHDALWTMPRVGSPVPSPDGKWVVYSQTNPAYDDKDQTSDLWIVPADGSARPRRITSTKAGESGATWSPDGTRLAFTARREGDEASQLYVLNMTGGGDAERMTSISTGVTSPAWRPDGGALLFVSSVPAGAVNDEDSRRIADERKNRKYNARVYTGFPIRYWDRWLDDSKPHVFVVELAPGARPRDLLAGTKLAAAPGFAGRTTETGHTLDAVWTPDGASIVFAADVNQHEAAFANVVSRLYVVPAAGGEPRAFTEDPRSYSRPMFSPDGRALYALVEENNTSIYNLTRVARVGWPAAEAPTVLTRTFDRSVATMAITPDSRTLYLLAEDEGLEKLYVVAAEGGDVKLAVAPATGVYGALKIPPKTPEPRIFATWESAVHPAEVVRIDTARRRHELVTRVTVDRAAALAWEPLRSFTFTSSRGKSIHSFLALPPNFDPSRKYPLFVLIHGGPHSMWRDQISLRWNYHLLASPGFVVLATNYTGSTGFGERFAQEIQLDPFAGPGQELLEAADEAMRRFPFIDADRQAAGGASYGGHLSNWLQGTTTRFRCLVSHAGLIDAESQWGTSDTIYGRELMNGGPPWEPGKVWREQNPIRLAAGFKTPVLITHSERDYRVPINHALEYWSVLQRLRVPSRLIVFPEENHWILKPEDSRFFYNEVLGWLSKYLLAPTAETMEGGRASPFNLHR
jgi:dipeptidyl aminopeptidase/acylaminoacyl peptidase